MEFVAFILCMSIIAQINAAPALKSGSDVPYNDNEFVLPAIAREGFEMILKVTIADKYQDIVKDKDLKVVLLPNKDKTPEICGSDTAEVKHTRICIVPKDDQLLNRLGTSQNLPTLQTVRITARPNREGDGLALLGYLNGSHDLDGNIALDEFEELKHFSVGGIAGEIQNLQFDFTNQR